MVASLTLANPLDCHDSASQNLAMTNYFSLDSAFCARFAKSKSQILVFAVEVVEFLADFGRKARLESAQCPKSAKSPQGVPKDEFKRI